MRILLFGTGIYYDRYKARIPADVEIVGMLDNAPGLWGSEIDGNIVYSPEMLFSLPHDFIVLLSARAYEMKEQLLRMGVDAEKILHWGEFYKKLDVDESIVYGEEYLNEGRKSVLIITAPLYYNGGALAAVYAARALRQRGFCVALMAPEADPRLVQEILVHKIAIMVCPVLPYIEADEMGDTDRFDWVMVNVFPMIRCACEMSKRKPVLWWVHENSREYDILYEQVRKTFPEYDDVDKMKNIHAVAVSHIARKNFNRYYPGKIRETLAYGIPDMGFQKSRQNRTDRTIFAIVGNICVRKGQEIFLEAIRSLSADQRENAAFWIIGKGDNSAYCKMIEGKAQDIPQVKLLGELTREEIDEAYRDIDVLVCASLEETMSIAVTEGMMYGKICITTDATGMADHIEDGVNGFICKAGNADELGRQMAAIIEEDGDLPGIGKRARETYEEHFTLEEFGKRLETILTRYCE